MDPKHVGFKIENPPENLQEEYGAEKANLRVSDIYDGLLDKTGYIQALEEQGTVEADREVPEYYLNKGESLDIQLIKRKIKRKKILS